MNSGREAEQQNRVLTVMFHTTCSLDLNQLEAMYMNTCKAVIGFRG